MKMCHAILLVFAAGLVIFLRCRYMTGLYYDVDIASKAFAAKHFLLDGDPIFFFRGIIPPGPVLIYCLAFLAFGFSFVSVQIIALAFDLVSLCFLYAFGRVVLGPKTRLYYFLPLLAAPFLASEALQGHSANIETFIIPFEILAALLLGVGARRKNTLFYGLAGAVLGLAFMIKQTAFPYWLAGLLFILIDGGMKKTQARLTFKRAGVYALFFVLPFFAAALGLSLAGRFAQFFESKIVSVYLYIRNIGTLNRVYFSWTIGQILAWMRVEVFVVGSLAAVGLVSSVRRIKEPERLLCVLWCVLPFLAVAGGGPIFRHHYLELLAPFLILGVIGFCDLYDASSRLAGALSVLKTLLLVFGLVFAGYCLLHMPLSLLKERRFSEVFLLTQKYVESPASAREPYRALLIQEDYDSARRFLAGRYIAEHAPKDETIFVWDYLGSGAVYFWAERAPVKYQASKISLLPPGLKDPVAEALYRPFKDEFREYGARQKRLMEHLEARPPFYIVLIRSAKPMPKAPPIEETMAKERKAFPAFFAFISRNFVLEIVMDGSEIYRRKD